ncbi:uncharacterized protein B0H18DRAFT_1038689, partial [Fomitopsis serialis]|uniref:uncharacterized protein n=1 Tax=Fomitopsis serialis TaxID=139415 RepID=UPI0020076EFE
MPSACMWHERVASSPSRLPTPARKTARRRTTTMALFFPLATVLSHVRAVLGLPRTSSATNGAKVYYVSDYEEILTHETALHLRSGAATPGLLFFIPLTDNHYVFFGVTRHTVYDQLVIALSHTVKVSLNEPELTICWVNNAQACCTKRRCPLPRVFGRSRGAASARTTRMLAHRATSPSGARSAMPASCSFCVPRLATCYGLWRAISF